MRRLIAVCAAAVLAAFALTGCTRSTEWASAVGMTDDGEPVAVLLRCDEADPPSAVVLADREAIDAGYEDDDDDAMLAATLVTWTGVAPGPGESPQLPLLGPAPDGVTIDVRDDQLQPDVTYAIGVPPLHPWNEIVEFTLADVDALEPGTMIGGDGAVVPLGEPTGCP